MTTDFIDQLSDACDKEGCAYLLIVQSRGGKAADVQKNLDNWKTVGVGKSVKEDILQLLDVTIFDD